MFYDYGTRTQPADPPPEAIIYENKPPQVVFKDDPTAVISDSLYERLTKGVSIKPLPELEGKGGGIVEGAKQVWEGSLGGYAQRAYEGLVGNGEGGGFSISKMLSTGTFIVLGVVIIALAVLSNKTVQNVAVKAVTKGA